LGQARLTGSTICLSQFHINVYKHYLFKSVSYKRIQALFV
jgi:hypothetical protein